MFSKLLNHDFINTRRYGFPILFLILCMGILGCVFSFLCIKVFPPSNASTVQIFFFISGTTLLSLSIIGLFALCGLMMIFMMIYFYKNLVTDEAYLTFTLPVSPAQILSSKLFTAFFWNMISWIAAVLSFTLMLLPGYFMASPAYEYLHTLFQFYTVHQWITAVLWLINFIISNLSTMLMVYAAIILGAVIARKHKIAVAIGLVFAVSAIKSTFVSLFNLSSTLFYDALYLQNGISNYYDISNIFMIIINAVFSIVFFFLTKYLLEKKLNLE